MDTTVEVTVAGQYGGGVQIAVDDLLLDLGVECTGHAVTGGAGETDDTEAQFLQFRQQARFFQVQLGNFGAGRKRSLDPGLAEQTQ